MKRFLLHGIPLLAVVAAMPYSRGNPIAVPTLHNFQLNLHGTPGVRLHLLLITKATQNANLQRRDEVVTLPTKIDFKAVGCYAWLDTLPNGASGNDGDECNVDLIEDGHKTAICNGIIKKQNKQTQEVGDCL